MRVTFTPVSPSGKSLLSGKLKLRHWLPRQIIFSARYSLLDFPQDTSTRGVTRIRRPVADLQENTNISCVHISRSTRRRMSVCANLRWAFPRRPHTSNLPAENSLNLWTPPIVFVVFIVHHFPFTAGSSANASKTEHAETATIDRTAIIFFMDLFPVYL